MIHGMSVAVWAGTLNGAPHTEGRHECEAAGVMSMMGAKYTLNPDFGAILIHTVCCV